MATDTTAPAPEAPPQPGPSKPSHEPRLGGVAGILVPLLLVVVAGVIRFDGLGHPERIYFDETYYAPQGQELITRGAEEGFAVHPPVGKWLIGAGVAVLGYDEFGFRAASAAAGTLLVLVTYLLGLRLFRRRGVAAMAALFVAVDGLALTMSRIAMLDIFLALFTALGVWFLLLDRDRMWVGVPPAAPEHDAALPRRPHPWRWFAGLAFGLAIATKWSAILPLAGAGIFIAANELLWRRRVTGSPWTGWWRGAGNAALTLVAVPLLVYVVSYAGWFANFENTRLGLQECPDGVCQLSTPDIAAHWWAEQREIAHFHLNLDAEHPYRSRASTWPYLGRPIAYYYESCDDQKLADGTCVTEPGNVEHILGVGNPAIWWLGIAAFPLLLWFSVRRWDWRAGTILGFYAVQYAPWLFVGRPNFLFYLTPAVPFLCLGLAYAVWRLSGQWFARWLPVAVCLLVVGAFVFWHPVWTGQEIPLGAWQLRMWLQSWI